MRSSKRPRCINVSTYGLVAAHAAGVEVGRQSAVSARRTRLPGLSAYDDRSSHQRLAECAHEWPPCTSCRRSRNPYGVLRTEYVEGTTRFRDRVHQQQGCRPAGRSFAALRRHRASDRGVEQRHNRRCNFDGQHRGSCRPRARWDNIQQARLVAALPRPHLHRRPVPAPEHRPVPRPL
jgi:hypothetical protein